MNENKTKLSHETTFHAKEYNQHTGRVFVCNRLYFSLTGQNMVQDMAAELPCNTLISFVIAAFGFYKFVNQA